MQDLQDTEQLRSAGVRRSTPGTGGPACWNMPEWDLMRPLGVAGGDTGGLLLPRLSCGDTCTASHTMPQRPDASSGCTALS